MDDLRCSSFHDCSESQSKSSKSRRQLKHSASLELACETAKRSCKSKGCGKESTIEVMVKKIDHVIDVWTTKNILGHKLRRLQHELNDATKERDYVRSELVRLDEKGQCTTDVLAELDSLSKQISNLKTKISIAYDEITGPIPSEVSTNESATNASEQLSKSSTDSSISEV